MDFPNSPIPEPLNADNLVPSYKPPSLPDGDNTLLDLIKSGPAQNTTSSYNVLDHFSYDTPASSTALSRGVTSNWKDSERYRNSSMFNVLGWNKNENNEYKYGERQSWGDVWKNALGGAWQIGKNMYVEGWKGWGRMADAVASSDWSKLVADSPEELQSMNDTQNSIMNKYAIFATPKSDGTFADQGFGKFFNRSFFGNMIQQSGFALGATAQFLSEELITMGLSTEFSVAKLGLHAPEWLGRIVTKADVLKSMTQLGENVWKSKSLVEKMVQGARKFVPLAETASDISKFSKAGAGALQMAAIGVGGVKRFLAEANMAMVEARMEAAGTYGQLYTNLQNEEMLKTGQSVDPLNDEKMKALSMDAAHDNFWVNSGILMLSNRIQFDNMFKKFSVGRKIMGEEGGYAANLIKVNGTDKLGQKLTQVYEKGRLGVVGTFGQISKDFGAKKAAWEITKNVQKGLMKWETSEGLQEVFQDLSNNTMQSYYYDLYHGAKGMGMGKSIEDAIKQEGQNDQWMTTFLMGALTGALISPVTKAISFGQERIGSTKEKRDARKADIKENVDMLNAFYSNPNMYLNEHIANVKIQNKAATTMDEALANRDSYQFKNDRDSAFARTIAASIKTDMFESVMHTLKEFPQHFNDEQFKEAFPGVDPTETNQKNVSSFFGTIAKNVEQFHNTWQTLKERYSDLVLPDLYKKGTPEREVALFAKKALDDSIEMLATIDYKSKAAITRAITLQQKIAAIPNYGSSVENAFRTLGHDQTAKNELSMLRAEITAMKASTISDPNTKKLLRAKEKQYEALNGWIENLDTLQGEHITEKRRSNKARKGFTDYVNAKNDQSGQNVIIRTQDFNDHYHDLIDYMQLYKDHGDYIDAYNTLSNPIQFVNMNERIIDAIKNTRNKFKDEHVDEIADKMRKSGVSEDKIKEFLEEAKKPSAEDLDKLAAGLEVKKTSSEVSPVVTTDDELEKHLKITYNKIKIAAESQGNTIPDYETWKASAGQYETDRYNKIKREEAEKKKEGAPKPTASNNEGKIIINGRVATLTGEINKNNHLWTIEYLYDTDKENLTQEEQDDLTGSLLYNTNTKEYQDENGNKVVVSKYTIEKPPAPTTSTSPKPGGEIIPEATVPIISGTIWIKPSDNQKYEFLVKDGKIISGFVREMIKDEYGKETTGSITQIENPLIKYNELVKDPNNADKITNIGPKKTTTPVEKPKPTGLEIEPQIERGDYGKVFILARKIISGKMATTPDELHSQATYPKLLERFIQLEKNKINEIDALINKHESEGGLGDDYTEQREAIEEKYKTLARNLIGYVKEEEYDESGDIKDWAQTNDRAKLLAMRSASEFAGKQFQVSWRQITPSQSLANTTDIAEFVDIGGNKIGQKRVGINPKYAFNIATPNFKPGHSVEFRVVTTDEEYDYLNSTGGNRRTKEKYDRNTLFDKNGKAIKEKFDEIPIAVYTKMDGKDVLIGTVHEPLWITDKIGGVYVNIAPAPGMEDNIEEHVKNEVKKNIDFRTAILESFNKDATFSIAGHITQKSNGILKVMETQDSLKSRVNPKIGEGGIKNRHGFFGIIRNGQIMTANNIAAEKLEDTDTFGSEKINSYPGVTVLCLPTPTGKFMPTFVALPKLNKGKAEFIYEAWRAFTGKTVNPDLVNAVYSSVNMVMSDTPEIGVLRTYIQQYLTRLESTKESLSPDGKDLKDNFARLYINDDGNLTIEVKYPIVGKGGQQSKDYVYAVIRKEEDIIKHFGSTEGFMDALQELRTTIKFPDKKNDSLIGINSTGKTTFLSMDNGKLVKQNMTYNEYLMQDAQTLVEKGTDSKNSDGDWVYFANPVLQMDFNKNLGDPSPVEETTPDVTPDNILETAPEPSGVTADDLFAKLMRDGLVNNMTDEQIKEEAQKCGAFGGDA